MLGHLGGSSPKHSQLQLELALEAAHSPRPNHLNLIQQQQQQQGLLHSSQQFARPFKRARSVAYAGAAVCACLLLPAGDACVHACLAACTCCGLA